MVEHHNVVASDAQYTLRSSMSGANSKIRNLVRAMIATALLPACSRDVACPSCDRAPSAALTAAATAYPSPFTTQYAAGPATQAPLRSRGRRTSGTSTAMRKSRPESKPAPARPALPKGVKTTSAQPDAARAPQRAKPLSQPRLSGGRVRNAKEYFSTLEERFVPGASKGMRAVFQFDLTGPDAIAYHVAVADGTMRLERGLASDPSVTLRASAEDYVKIVNGELDGTRAVFSGKMSVSGDLILAQKMKEVFPGGSQE